MRFGTDGVRGLANVDLTAEDALRLGRAAGRTLGAATVVIGGDTRRSTPMLEAALAAGFAAEGIEVVHLGVVPTPAVAFHAHRTGAMGAMVSASHNPHHDNGIKLFAPGGTKLTDDLERAVEGALDDLARPAACAPGGEPGSVHGDGAGAAIDAYVEHLLSVLDGRTLEGLHVVVDAANGAASGLAGPVLTRTGARTTVIHAAPDGRNINDGCGATDVASLGTAVREVGADIGLALDGDADRVIGVDELGEPVDGDRIIALCARDLRDRGRLRDSTVVATVMANLGFRRAMEAEGIEVVETPVGDRHVLSALDAGGWSLGGEQSGHVIFHDVATTGDGLLTGLVLADLVRRAGRPLSELAGAVMERFPQVLVNVTVPGSAAERVAAVEALADRIAAAEAGLDGDGRVLVRPSGTEPIVRVMVEAADDATARRVADDLAGALRQAGVET